MKVFISWSGPRSGAAGEALRVWLPAVIQAVRPYYSPSDIAKGTRWSGEIASELSQSQVGILCITKENLSAPWLMFEAGALSKSMDVSRVIPLLLDVEPGDLTGPLVQFQAARFDRADVRKLLAVINDSLGELSLEATVLDAVFDKWWPDLQSRIDPILRSSSSPSETVSARADRDVLDEVLTLVRQLSYQKHSSSSLRVPELPVRIYLPILALPVGALELSDRSISCLKANGIDRVSDLVQMTEDELIRVPNLGRKAFNEIIEKLAELGVSLPWKFSTS